MAGVSVHSLFEAEAGLALSVVVGRSVLQRKIGGVRIQKPAWPDRVYQHVHPEGCRWSSA